MKFVLSLVSALFFLFLIFAYLLFDVWGRYADFSM